MTRGKHAAQSATRRADAAEVTADRYIEEAARWKRMALANKAAADQFAGVQKELRRLRDEPTVALSDHERVVTALRVERAEYEQQVTAHMVTVIDRLGEMLAHYMPNQDHAFKTLCIALLDALRELPDPVADKLWDRFEFERELRRELLQPGFAKWRGQDIKPTLIKLAMKAEGAGYGHNAVPASWVHAAPWQGLGTKPQEPALAIMKQVIDGH